MVRKFIKIILYGIAGCISLLVVLDLLISDFGPNETSNDRLIAFIILTLLSGGTFYLIKRFI